MEFPTANVGKRAFVSLQSSGPNSNLGRYRLQDPSKAPAIFALFQDCLASRHSQCIHSHLPQH
ncbi:unnamed protein product [Haemonchus placei]|uniref:Uncharacterized protein n=1 Tax=Haemonchus placei TaxID=6290 RepID=A0A158QPH3_HAEPC|nr:unnamed protein product [Haemonchus placei]